MLTGNKLGWNVFPIGDNGEPSKKQITYAYGDTPGFVLPAGNYMVRVKRGSAVAEAVQLITAGENHELVIDLRAGELSFNAVLNEGAAPYDASIGWTAHTVDDEGVRAKQNAAYSYGASGTYTLTAGRYALKAKAGSIERWVEVDVPAGEKASVTVQLDGGVLAFDASLTETGGPVASGSLGWSARAVDEGGTVASKQIAYSYGVSGNYVLPTGDYELKVKVGAIERV